MPTFGFSAFLKLICLNERPQRPEIRKRLSPGSGSYDFHRSLRLRAHRYLVKGEPIEQILASTAEIKQAAEQRSARAGLERLERWRCENPGAILSFVPATYESPTGLFRVVFTPDIGIGIGRDSVAVHLWNTAKPVLVRRMVYAALSLIASVYASIDNSPDEVAVLSLPESRLYRLSEAGRFAGLGASLAGRIEDMLRDTIDELDFPPPENRPGSPF